MFNLFVSKLSEIRDRGRQDFEKSIKVNWFVIFERCNVSQSGRKFSKTEGIEILKKSVIEKFTRIHRHKIQ